MIPLSTTYGRTTLDPAVRGLLLHARIPVRYGYYVVKGTGRFYQHAKTMVISGRMGRRDVHRVWSGSQNWTMGGQTRNNETLVRNGSASVCAAYLRQWAIWNRWTVPLKSMASTATATPPPGLADDE